VIAVALLAIAVLTTVYATWRQRVRIATCHGCWIEAHQRENARRRGVGGRVIGEPFAIVSHSCSRRRAAYRSSDGSVELSFGVARPYVQSRPAVTIGRKRPAAKPQRVADVVRIAR
jgi:hypothetical protein